MNCGLEIDRRPPASAGRLRQTNPISGGRARPGGRGVLYKRTQFLPSCRSADRRSREGRLRQTNPICPPWREMGAARRSYEQSQFRAPSQPGADCAKQTQSGAASWRTGTDYAKRTQSGAARAVPAGQFCQTKPIPAVGRGCQGAKRAKRTQLPEAGHRGGVRRAGPPTLVDRAKQTQFGGPPGDRAADYAKQTQSAGPEAGCTNEPNSCPYADPETGVPGRGKCAKQTQTWAR
jgi:hypothetical protein